MRAVLVSLGSLIVAAACQGSAGQPDYSAVFDGSGGRWIDLSYVYSEETLYWPTEDGFQLEELAYGETEAGYFYSSYKISTAEHGGTHLDAPIHFSRGGMSAEQIPLDRLIAPAVVVDVAARATPDYLIGVGDLEEWERTHGRIPDGAILLLRTGWGQRWPDRLGYLGTERTGPEAVAELHFPGIHPEAARWITDQRNVAAVGIDTPSIDYGQSTGFEAHVIIYGSDIPGFENVANLQEIPEVGAFVVALPMKVAGGSGGPLRIVAFVPFASDESSS
ncbi:MAG TPA: cyclase [Gemmatimonadetes bacterium]|jgi:kynurenine formamidase|nr:cyclase [Gemmatimonadota bacterium]|tara:strand:- start:179 stop:1009 length:831 start_codon:yes stop_codon:yes gene_type:complete